MQKYSFIHKRYSSAKKLKIAIAGASGLVGKALMAFLRTGGHTVIQLVRRPMSAGADTIVWNPYTGELDPEALNGVDAVINLAGESIARGRWNARQKERILHSRVLATKTLVMAMSAMQRPPATLINASAIGYYGNRGDQLLSEESVEAGRDFLANVCIQWEEAAKPLANSGVRVVFARFGIILSAEGGALAQMLTPFKLGLGGTIGSGNQYMSWIAIDDVLGALLHVLMTEELQGPVNVTAPEPVTNASFTKALGSVLHRPTLLPMPAFLVRLLFGEKGDALLLSSSRVYPEALLRSGYQFFYPNLPKALEHLL
jgi:uncharacterized protein (TIGR01777 family)